MKRSAVFFLTIMATAVFGQKVWTLEESVNYALANNLQVIQNSFSKKQQDYNLQIAKRQYLPSVSANINNNLNFGQGTDMFGNSNRNDNFRNNTNVGADVLLFNHGRLEKNIRRTEFEVEAAQYDVEKVKNDISLQIAQQYLSVLLNREVTRISESAFQNAEKIYQRAKITTEVGTTPQTVLAEAEAARAREKLNVKTAQINTDRSLFALAMLLQLPDYKNFDIQNVSIDSEIEAPLYPASQVIDKAFENQPQVKAAESRIKSAEAQIAVTETGFWPTVTASAGFGTSYFNSFSDTYGAAGQQSGFFNQYKDNFGQQVGLAANIPIFNKGITKLNIEQAKLNVELARTSLLVQKQEVLQNVQQAQFDAESNYESYMTSLEVEKSAKLALDFAEKSYNAGRTTVYEYNNALNNYANAQGSVAQAKYNYLFSLKLLNFYAGIPLSL